MKELPYFKFYPSEWLAGDINYLSADVQGVFISACVHYWARGCSLTIAELKQRHSKDIADLILLLAKNGIVILDGENISIKFLDDQLKEYETLHSKRAEAGRTGSMKRWQKDSPPIATPKPPYSPPIAKDNNKEGDKEGYGNGYEEKNNTPISPQGDLGLNVPPLKNKFIATLNEQYHHKPTTEWQDKAKKKLAEILKRADAEAELGEIMELYNSGYQYYRKDILTLLNNWQGELERARIEKAKKGGA